MRRWRKQALSGPGAFVICRIDTSVPVVLDYCRARTMKVAGIADLVGEAERDA